MPLPRILIVDDTPSNLQTIGSLLRETGLYRISLASSGMDALALCERLRPDLILLDIMMPEMDGFETLEHLRNIPTIQDVPVLFVTARVEKEDVVRGLQMGAMDYITKPVVPEILLARVRNHVLAGQTLILLRERNEHLALSREAIFATASVSITDAHGIILDISPAFEAASGYSKDELIGKTHAVLRSGVHGKAFWQRFWETIQGGNTFYGEVCNRNKGGELYWSRTGVSPLYDADRNITGYIAVRHDITPLMKMSHDLDESLHHMRHLQEVEVRLRSHERLSALARMGTGIAHEVNQPLTYISAVVQSLQRQLKRGSKLDEPATLEMLTESRRQVERIGHILRRLRSMAEEDSGLASAVSWPEALDGAMLVSEQRLIAAGIFLERDIAPDLPRVQGSQSAYERLLILLFDNAIDAMKDSPRRDLKLRMALDGDLVHLSLTDSGHGMDADTQAQAFDPYFTTRDPARHAGLGLSTGLATVTRYGGTIRLDSQPDAGTTVELVFPALSEEEATRIALRPALPRLRWHDGLSVGHTEVDSDHRELFAIANAAMDAIDRDDSHEMVLAAIEALLDYTLEHFEREEGFWRDGVAPTIAQRAHSHEHAELKKQLQALHGRCIRAEERADTDFIDFFREWVINHVLVSDLRMAQAIARQQTAPEGA